MKILIWKHTDGQECPRSLRLVRQGKDNARPADGGAFGVDAAAVELDDVFDDAEAKAGAAPLAGAALVDAVEALEDVGQVLFRDAGPVVLDGADDQLVLRIELDPEDEPGKVRGVAEDVFGQVIKDLGNTVAVKGKVHHPLVILQGDVLKVGVDSAAVAFDAVLHQGLERLGDGVDLIGLRFKPGEREQVLDQHVKSLGVPDDFT